MTPEKRMQILKSWRDLCNLCKSMEVKILQLARHPEATPEQLIKAAATYKRTYEATKEVAHKMKQFGMRYHCEHVVAKSTLTEA